MSDKPLILAGSNASPGIAIGRACVLEHGSIQIPEYEIEPQAVEPEIERFHEAVNRSKEQLAKVKEQISEVRDLQHAFIIDTHILILEDEMVISETERNIRERYINAEWALRMVVERLERMFGVIDDEYLRERRTDLDFVADRVLRNLTGVAGDALGKMPGPVIMVAHDLSPADTAQLDRTRVIGFATDVGTKTSHTAIVARSLGIPAVLGLERISRSVTNGDILIVDGLAGLVRVNADTATLEDYEKKREDYLTFEQELLKYTELPAETRDGYRIEILGNAELPQEIHSLISHGAAGIGLYRTEFLFLNRRDLPSEEEQLQVYRSVVEEIAPHAAVVRTLDLGGEKGASSLGSFEETNPALGLRGIRLSLQERGIFKTQIRAILRASSYGKLKIMFPMISGVGEIRQAKEIVEECREELRKEGKPFDPNIQIGAMIETPSSVVIADLLAREVDFFSIGTNDLIQYSLAIDRVNEHVAYLYEPLHPANIRMVRRVVRCGHERGIPVMMCGEMAGDAWYIFVLLGLEIDQLSMNALSIPKVKKLIREATLNEAKVLVERILEAETAREVSTMVREEMARRFPQSFR